MNTTIEKILTSIVDLDHICSNCSNSFPVDGGMKFIGGPKTFIRQDPYEGSIDTWQYDTLCDECFDKMHFEYWFGHGCARKI